MWHLGVMKLQIGELRKRNKGTEATSILIFKQLNLPPIAELMILESEKHNRHYSANVCFS